MLSFEFESASLCHPSTCPALPPYSRISVSISIKNEFIPTLRQVSQSFPSTGCELRKQHQTSHKWHKSTDNKQCLGARREGAKCWKSDRRVHSLWARLGRTQNLPEQGLQARVADLAKAHRTQSTNSAQGHWKAHSGEAENLWISLILGWKNPVFLPLNLYHSAYTSTSVNVHGKNKLFVLSKGK